MLRKFAEGLAFGAGFGIAIAAVWTLLGWLTTPSPVPRTPSESVPPDAQYERFDNRSIDEESSAALREAVLNRPIEDQIAEASAIAIVRYEQAEDGRMKAIIAEIPKRHPDTRFFPAVGDEYPRASFYPGGDSGRGTGAVIFFEGTPPAMRMMMSVDEGRISGLGDMPIEIFREKAAQAGQ